jgi:hypothetical protein
VSTHQDRRLAEGIDIEVKLLAKGAEQQAKAELELDKLVADNTARVNLVESFKSELASAGVAAPQDLQLSTISAASSVEISTDDSLSNSGTPNLSEGGSSAGVIVGVVVAVAVVGALAGFALYSKKAQEKAAEAADAYKEKAIVSGEQRSHSITVEENFNNPMTNQDGVDEIE